MPAVSCLLPNQRIARGKEQAQVRDTDNGIYGIYKYYYEPEELRSLLENALGKVERL